MLDPDAKHWAGCQAAGGHLAHPSRQRAEACEGHLLSINGRWGTEWDNSFTDDIGAQTPNVLMTKCLLPPTDTHMQEYESGCESVTQLLCVCIIDETNGATAHDHSPSWCRILTWRTTAQRQQGNSCQRVWYVKPKHCRLIARSVKTSLSLRSSEQSC